MNFESIPKYTTIIFSDSKLYFDHEILYRFFLTYRNSFDMNNTYELYIYNFSPDEIKSFLNCLLLFFERKSIEDINIIKMYEIADFLDLENIDIFMCYLEDDGSDILGQIDMLLLPFDLNNNLNDNDDDNLNFTEKIIFDSLNNFRKHLYYVDNKDYIDNDVVMKFHEKFNNDKLDENFILLMNERFSFIRDSIN